MKKITKIFLKVIILLFVIFSSGLALYIHYIEDFDPVKMAVNLKNENNRDRSLDVIQFGLENKIGDQEELKYLQNEYEYSDMEKSKDLFLHGAVKGNVFNMYSGIGCVAADLCLFGDVRDLAKEGYHFTTGKDVDYVVAGLSGIGVGTTALVVTGGGATVDAGVSVVKTVFKYTTKTIKKTPDSLLKAVMTGKKFSAVVYKKIWILFKETKYSIPNITTILSKIKDIKYLDGAVDLTKKMKKGSVIFLNKTGENGLKTYEYFKKLGLGNFFTSSFKINPKGVLGVTKFHTIIHSAKIFKKHGFLIPIIIVISSIAAILAMFPLWAIWVLFIVLCVYFARYVDKKIFKRKQHSIDKDLPAVNRNI